MATNDFLPFAVGAGANVLSQTDYAAQTAIASGYSAGIAKSAALNKTWRQSSIMAAVLAQFIANQTGANSVDDGTTATLLANLLAAVKSSSNAVVGSVRNLSMIVAAASASATMTADEIIVETALGGQTYRLASFNKTINLATTGAGGMDTGAAPASGFVALYAIYNPTTGASALLATNATAAAQPNVYGGANMPTGYTASALVSVWPTNSSGLLAVAGQIDRSVTFPVAVAATTNVQVTGAPAVSFAAFIPKNAKTASGLMSIATSNATTATVAVYGSTTLLGQQQCSACATTGGAMIGSSPFNKVPLFVPQTVYWNAQMTGGTFGAATLYASGYDF